MSLHQVMYTCSFILQAWWHEKYYRQ